MNRGVDHCLYNIPESLGTLNMIWPVCGNFFTEEGEKYME